MNQFESQKRYECDTSDMSESVMEEKRMSDKTTNTLSKGKHDGLHDHVGEISNTTRAGLQKQSIRQSKTAKECR